MSEFLTSFVVRYTGCGDVVRCRYELPSVRVTNWVKVYGRFGRRRRVAFLVCWRQWLHIFDLGIRILCVNDNASDILKEIAWHLIVDRKVLALEFAEIL